MALERKDLRLKLDAVDHDRLKVVCEHDNMDIGEWAEQLILRELDRREAEARKAASLAERLERLGKTGRSREEPGTVSQLRTASHDSQG